MRSDILRSASQPQPPPSLLGWLILKCHLHLSLFHSPCLIPIVQFQVTIFHFSGHHFPFPRFHFTGAILQVTICHSHFPFLISTSQVSMVLVPFSMVRFPGFSLQSKPRQELAWDISRHHFPRLHSSG